MKIDKKSILEYIEEYGGAAEALKGFCEVVDKRSYFSVKEFDVIRKNMNLAFPAAGLLSGKVELVAEAIEGSIDFREKQIISKIDRMSNMDLKRVEETYEKLLYKNSFEYILKYAKELLLRDSKSFYKITYRFVLSDNMRLLKPLMLLSFEKMKRTDDEFIILLMSYLTKARSDYSCLENENYGETWHSFEFVKEQLKNVKELLESKEGLGILSYCLAMERYEISEEDKKIVSILHNAIQKLKDGKTELENRVEKALVSKLIEELNI